MSSKHFDGLKSVEKNRLVNNLIVFTVYVFE